MLSNAGNTVAYTEQQTSPSAVLVDSGITVTDADSLTLNSVTVKITSGAFAGDLLDVITTGTAITAAWNGTDTLTLTGPDTPIDFQHVLQSVTFSSSSDDPTDGGADTTRTIIWVAKDNFDVSSIPVTTTIDVTAVNDGPVAAITPTSYSATEQTALNLKNSGLSVSDVDGNTGSETVTLSVGEGTLTVIAGTSGATVGGSGTGTVTITGTVANINTLLNTDGTSAVSYIDNTDTPSASTGLTLTIHDNGHTGGSDLSSTATSTINITAVNDAPVATIAPASYSVTENATLSLKSNGLSVSDVDGNAGSETVTLSVTDGILNVTAGGSNAGVSGSGTSSVTITGTTDQIDALLNTDTTSTVAYVENDDNPGTTATLSLTIHDNGNTGTGGDLSSTDTATLNITAVNDAPVATITPTSYAATEQTALNLKNNGLSVSDIDGNSGSETVTLSVGEGTLTVTAGGSGATVSNSGSGTVTITGTAADIDALLNTDGTSTVSYIDPSDTPSASTSLTLTIHDNGNTGTGGDHSSTATSTINITAVNDPPVFTNLGGTHPHFTENGVSVVLDNNVTVSDVELNAAGGNYGGTTLSLVRDGGANSDDVFGGTGPLDLSHSDINGQNVSIDGGAHFIGTATNTGDGTFSITFDSAATAANIATVMQHITYANASDNPPTSVQIDWSFNDGNTGSQGIGGPGIATGSVTVDITQVDDAPVLINVAPTAIYEPGTAGATLSMGLQVFDVDASAPSTLLGLASATVHIARGFFAGDELFVNLPTSGGHFITPDNVTTNISVQSDALGDLVLSGNDTVADHQAVLDAVSYHSTAADPSNGGSDLMRTITWEVNDGVLNSQIPLPETMIEFGAPPQFDGQTLRLEFCVSRLDEQKPPAAVTGKRYPACRLVLPPAAAIDLMNKMQQITAGLIKAGVLKADAPAAVKSPES